MNRYMALGVASDLEQDLNVLVVCGSDRERRDVFRYLADALGRAEVVSKVVRSNGHERITAHGGAEVRFAIFDSRSSTGCRGVETDVLVLTAEANDARRHEGADFGETDLRLTVVRSRVTEPVVSFS